MPRAMDIRSLSGRWRCGPTSTKCRYAPGTDLPIRSEGHREAAPAARSVEIAGRWDVSVQYESGSAEHKLFLSANRNKVSGTHVGWAFEGELTGAVNGDKVELETVLPVGGQRLRYGFSGRHRRHDVRGSGSRRIRLGPVDCAASHRWLVSTDFFPNAKPSAMPEPRRIKRAMQTKRVAAADTEFFNQIERDLYSAVLADSLDELGHHECAMSERLRPTSSFECMVGWAKTISARDVHYELPNPYDKEIEAVDSILPGEVIVVSTGNSRRNALWGELLSTAARATVW